MEIKNSLMQKIDQLDKNLDIRIFLICCVIFLTLLLFLFRYFFAAYLVVFFAACWGGVRLPKSWKKSRSAVLAFFLSYVLSAVFGFWFVGIE
ncbi:hypothetical protein QSV34_10905 [Porticoccus sp. W117]|uniref:hypothetical protein n=1 Tax=Porticoccus sp. W117 TaxID=3054777 RepID=UPI00259A767F|nr:hypothetical protein [Porticoccus sp. W117]MDM3871859.1 hypothetical protein [Porticoccus sp. W117]